VHEGKPVPAKQKTQPPAPANTAATLTHASDGNPLSFTAVRAAIDQLASYDADMSSRLSAQLAELHSRASEPEDALSILCLSAQQALWDNMDDAKLGNAAREEKPVGPETANMTEFAEGSRVEDCAASSDCLGSMDVNGVAKSGANSPSSLEASMREILVCCLRDMEEKVSALCAARSQELKARGDERGHSGGAASDKARRATCYWEESAYLKKAMMIAGMGAREFDP
jgi:hypothetical protein